MNGTDLNINVFDAVVLSILSISALVAFFRGFIRELLSLGAWVGAAVITLYLFPHADDMMKHHVKNDHLSGAMAALGTYIAALIAISILNSVIMRYVKTGMEVGLLDNFLGLVFGALRGAFILSLGFLIMSTVISKDNPPEWVKTSITKEYLQQGADMLVKVAPKYLSDIEGMIKEQREDMQNKRDDEKSEKGYRPEEQKDMNRLLDSSQPRREDIHRGQ